MTILRQRMSEDTQYLQQVSQFARHLGKSADELGAEAAYPLALTPMSLVSAIVG